MENVENDVTSKIYDVILPARNVSIVLSFFSRVSVVKLNLQDFENWNPIFQICPIFALIGLTAVKIAALGQKYLHSMYVGKPNILIYEVSGR